MTSIGLRYCAIIRAMFFQRLGENQPSWKFSLLPQNAQKQAAKVEIETAIHPKICCRLVTAALHYQKEFYVYERLAAGRTYHAFTRLTTLTRRFRTLLLSNLRACWRDPFGLPHEKH